MQRYTAINIKTHQNVTKIKSWRLFVNKNCNKEFCIYIKTCLINDKEKINKCTGILSEKNPHHHNYQMSVRGSN